MRIWQRVPGGFADGYSLTHVQRLLRAEATGERAGIELDGDLDGSGGLRLGHSDRGRAEGASGEARVGGGEDMVVGRPEGDLGAEDFLEGRRGRRAAIADGDQQTVAVVEQGL